MPPPSEPSQLALWAAALINPLPGLGVSIEIRPRVLDAWSVQKRLDLVYMAITRSIEHLETNGPI